MFDQFYPVSQTMVQMPQGIWQIQMAAKLAGHRQNAASGSKDAESRLCNRLGQLARNVEWKHLTDALREEVHLAVVYLHSVGRTVDLGGPDPRVWITTRGGLPRW